DLDDRAGGHDRPVAAARRQQRSNQQHQQAPALSGHRNPIGVRVTQSGHANGPGVAAGSERVNRTIAVAAPASTAPVTTQNHARVETGRSVAGAACAGTATSAAGSDGGGATAVCGADRAAAGGGAGGTTSRS